MPACGLQPGRSTRPGEGRQAAKHAFPSEASSCTAGKPGGEGSQAGARWPPVLAAADCMQCVFFTCPSQHNICKQAGLTMYRTVIWCFC